MWSQQRECKREWSVCVCVSECMERPTAGGLDLEKWLACSSNPGQGHYCCCCCCCCCCRCVWGCLSFQIQNEFKNKKCWQVLKHCNLRYIVNILLYIIPFIKDIHVCMQHKIQDSLFRRLTEKLPSMRRKCRLKVCVCVSVQGSQYICCNFHARFETSCKAMTQRHLTRLHWDGHCCLKQRYGPRTWTQSLFKIGND